MPIASDYVWLSRRWVIFWWCVQCTLGIAAVIACLLTAVPMTAGQSVSLIEALGLLPESIDRLATGAVSLQWRHTSLISVPCVLAAMAFAFSPARPYAHRKLALLGAAALCFIANPAGLLPCTIFSLPYYAVKGCSGESLRAGHATIGAVGTMMWIMLALWEHSRMTHRRAVRPRACVRCGYNLSGNTTNLCPECGEREASE